MSDLPNVIVGTTAGVLLLERAKIRADFERDAAALRATIDDQEETIARLLIRCEDLAGRVQAFERQADQDDGKFGSAIDSDPLVRYRRSAAFYSLDLDDLSAAWTKYEDARGMFIRSMTTAAADDLDIPVVRGGQGRDDWDLAGRGSANPVGLGLAVLFVSALAIAVALVLPAGQDGATSPCEFCGHPFDVDALGPYGCPNCHGEGLEVGE